jgi:hypothetical protein
MMGIALGAEGAARLPAGPGKPAIAFAAVPFDLKEVRLLDGPFRDAMLRDKAYLLSFEPDRLLHTFRITAGLPSPAKPLGGWEAPNCEVRGHSLGHYLSACALMYASTGDEQLKAKVDALVAELAKCQEALPSQGCNKGYLAAFPESFFDRVDAAKPVWAPYYTLHKIMAGLLDAHVHCGSRQALDVLARMADWLKLRVERLSVEQMQRALNNEHGGMMEVLANLYGVTGNPEHLRLACAFDHRVVFDPLARGEDRLNGLHANTQIPKITGAARVHELTAEARYRDIAALFWRRVALHRSYAVGGHSDHEHFFPVEQFSRHLSPATCETCNTYNMLKLTRHLFAWAPSAEAMDFYERALYNHILASQDPRTGMVIYFATLKPGHFKTYSTPFDSFWCCVGTGMENHARYGDTIYSHDDTSLFVNLFIPSELTWKDKGLVVRQETQFPAQDTTRLALKCERPVKLAFKIRCPSWAGSGATVAVNGKPESVQAKPGSYVAVEREWQNGDTVEVRLPMALHLEAMPDDPNTVAILYGPAVLAGELGTEGIEGLKPYAHGQLDFANRPTPEVPVLVCDAKQLLGRIEPVPDKPLAFQTKGVGRPRDVSLIPYSQLHHQRYTVYWKLYTEEGWKQKQAELAAAEAKRKEIERRTVDAARPGDPQSETGHQLKGERTEAGDFADKKWRHATGGGWFSYQMKVLPNEPMVLVCTYWGSDIGARRFDILVDGEKIAEQALNNNQPGQFLDVEYPIPPKLTQGKERVTVRFQAHAGSMAGGVFGLRAARKQPVIAPPGEARW